MGRRINGDRVDDLERRRSGYCGRDNGKKRGRKRREDKMIETKEGKIRNYERRGEERSILVGEKKERREKIRMRKRERGERIREKKRKKGKKKEETKKEKERRK